MINERLAFTSDIIIFLQLPNSLQSMHTFKKDINKFCICFCFVRAVSFMLNHFRFPMLTTWIVLQLVKSVNNDKRRRRMVQQCYFFAPLNCIICNIPLWVVHKCTIVFSLSNCVPLSSLFSFAMVRFALSLRSQNLFFFVFNIVLNIFKYILTLCAFVNLIDLQEM